MEVVRAGRKTLFWQIRARSHEMRGQKGRLVDDEQWMMDASTGRLRILFTFVFAFDEIMARPDQQRVTGGGASASSEEEERRD